MHFVSAKVFSAMPAIFHNGLAPYLLPQTLTGNVFINICFVSFFSHIIQFLHYKVCFSQYVLSINAM